MKVYLVWASYEDADYTYLASIHATKEKALTDRDELTQNETEYGIVYFVEEKELPE